jgi:hypothetical protein
LKVSHYFIIKKINMQRDPGEEKAKEGEELPTGLGPDTEEKGEAIPEQQGAGELVD